MPKKGFRIVYSLLFILCIFLFTSCNSKEHIHTYTSKIVKPTCINEGYTLHTCKCGDSYKDTYVEALGHKTNGYSVTEANCISDRIKSALCTRCHEIIIVKDEGSATGQHSYTDGKCIYCGDIQIPEELTFSYDDSTQSYTVTGIGDCQNLYIRIPENIDGKLVTAIGSSAFKNANVEEVYIPDSVTNIGESAFFECRSLTNIVIPDSVTSIEWHVFFGCKSLTSIVIPKSLTSIGVGAFVGCENLTNVYYDGTIEDWCNITFNSEFSNPMFFVRHLYMLDSKDKYREITEIEIPNTITKIGKNQFYGFNNVTTIIIPNSVTSIGAAAFSDCSNIASIVIPDSVTSIGGDAFAYCRSLASIAIPKSVTSIGASAFNNCISLTSITIPEGVTNIGKNAFNNCSNLTIYSEVTLQPSGWNFYWNNSNRPVYWYSEEEPTTLGNYWHYVNGEIVVW